MWVIFWTKISAKYFKTLCNYLKCILREVITVFGNRLFVKFRKRIFKNHRVWDFRRELIRENKGTLSSGLDWQTPLKMATATAERRVGKQEGERENGCSRENGARGRRRAMSFISREICVWYIHISRASTAVLRARSPENETAFLR